MAHSISFQDNTYQVGDTLDLMYRIVEGGKERVQRFTGILIKVRGKDENTRMITVRRNTKSGIGVERIIPLNSPFISSMKLVKKGAARRSKLYFIRELSDKNLRRKIYNPKRVAKVS